MVTVGGAGNSNNELFPGEISIRGNKINDGDGNLAIELSPTGFAVNHMLFTNAAAGNNPILSAAGDDADIDLNLSPKGTGFVNSTSSFKLGNNMIVDSGGRNAIGLVQTDNAVNYVEFTNAITGDNVILGVVGDEANVGLDIETKGMGIINLNSKTSMILQEVGHIANYGGGELSLVETTQTTDDTPTGVEIGILDEGFSAIAEVNVVAQETDESNRAAYKFIGLFYRATGGTTTQQGTTTSLMAIESDANWVCDFALDGNAINVQVTGAAATTVNWKVVAKLTRITTT